MRRRRNSKASYVKRDRDELGEVSHILKNYSGPSFSTLPREILVDVLVRLSVKRGLVCKSVCKTLHDLISGHEFAKFHFEQCQVYPLIRFPSLPNVLYLVQPEKDEFNLKLDMCDHTGARLACFCNVNVELDAKFELPLCCHRMINDDEDGNEDVFDSDGEGESIMINDDEDENEDAFDSDGEGEIIKFSKLDLEDHNYDIVNSCNGFICLSSPSHNDPLIVCNPVIGEFMKLPVPKTNSKISCIAASYGFGFSPATNQYKVIRICGSWLQDGQKYFSGLLAETLILGEQQWKEIGFFLFEECEPFRPTYLNGFLFWFSNKHPIRISCFDIEKELFGKVEAPPVTNTSNLEFDNKIGMGVLGEELCMIDVADDTFWNSIIHVWVMKDFGSKKEWSKVFSFDLYSNLGRAGGGAYKPIKFLNDGALLMSLAYHNVLIYKDPKKHGFRCLKLPLVGRAEVIGHTPSFVSLKQALSEQNVEVLNIKSRCTGLELQSEGNGLSIVEEEVVSDWDVESDSGDRNPGSDSEDRKLGYDSDE